MLGLLLPCIHQQHVLATVGRVCIAICCVWKDVSCIESADLLIPGYGPPCPVQVVERWLLNPYPNMTGILTVKESILLCQRLGTLDKMGVFEGPLRAKWEAAFVSFIGRLCKGEGVSPVSQPVGRLTGWGVWLLSLPLLLHYVCDLLLKGGSGMSEAQVLLSQSKCLVVVININMAQCTQQPTNQPTNPILLLPALQELRSDAFTKVERLFMSGLRSTSPDTRQEFFGLYNSTIAATIFDRLQFIILLQDWEAMASQFWLKHAAVSPMVACLKLEI